jgi:hypothetical protein
MLRAGDTLNLLPGGKVSTFGFTTEPGSIVNLSGGETSVGMLIRGEINIHSGAMPYSWKLSGGRMNSYGGGVIPLNFVENGSVVNIFGSEYFGLDNVKDSTVNVLGGRLDRITFDNSSTLNVSAGTLGHTYIGHQSVLNMYSGMQSGEFVVTETGTLHLLGGELDEMRVVGELNIHVRSVSVDGQPISGLVPGVPYLLSTRNATLAAVLLDGTTFTSGLSTQPGVGGDWFERTAVVRIILVPEPNSLALLLVGAVAAAACKRMI